MPHLEGKNRNEGSCPVCEILISPSDFIAPKLIGELLQCLVVECDQCKQVHNVHLNHTCNHHSPMQINDIFKLTDIPRIVDDATLHVLKHKMKATKSTTVEFQYGGPRVI